MKSTLLLLLISICAFYLSDAPVPAASTNEAKAKPSSAVQPPTPVVPSLSDADKQTAIQELRAKQLGLPLAGFDIASIKDSFNQTRGGIKHGAADMVAPRNTPVLAVEDGTIVKLFLSKAGGITIYQSDPTGKYVYYYAHLEKYAENLHDGDKVKKGQVVAYVGTSGNAPPDSPHLHFAIGVGDALKHWWQAVDLDPYEIFK
jgi:murein DD-endopeptidase MepM/ murein hydrolase activator NlpD